MALGQVTLNNDTLRPEKKPENVQLFAYNIPKRLVKRVATHEAIISARKTVLIRVSYGTRHVVTMETVVR